MFFIKSDLDVCPSLWLYSKPLLSNIPCRCVFTHVAWLGVLSGQRWRAQTLLDLHIPLLELFLMHPSCCEAAYLPSFLSFLLVHTSCNSKYSYKGYLIYLLRHPQKGSLVYMLCLLCLIHKWEFDKQWAF